MRIIPRYHIPGPKQLSQRLKRAVRYLTIARAMLMLELLILLGLLLFLFDSSRTAFLESLSRHASLLLLILVLAFAALWHLLISRRVAQFIERLISPTEYDERRILFDFVQEAHAATDLDELYESIVWRIKEALETENVSIFVRGDDSPGDYICRVKTPSMFDSSQSGGLALNPKLFLRHDAFVIKRLRHLTTPLIIEPGEFNTWERAFDSELREERQAREQELKTLKQIKSSLLLPIKIKGQLSGLVSLGPRRAQHKYSFKDKEMLMSMAGQLAFVIENSKLVERMVLEEQLRRELELAAEVQQGLLPRQQPELPGVDLAGFCQPARGIGGDYYDFILLDREHLGLAIADVAGKGISAALLMSNLQAALRSQTLASHAGVKPTLAELVSNINMLMCRSTGPASYVTFFYAQFDKETQQLTYVNAGHNPPILIRVQDTKLHNDGKSNLLSLNMGGPVLGFFEHYHYEQDTLQLKVGDLLLAYTDGVTEALNLSGEEFGDERLKDMVYGIRHLSANEIRDRLIHSLQNWCTDASQHDDLTFIILKIK